jgi:hypothetical protein
MNKLDTIEEVCAELAKILSRRSLFGNDEEQIKNLLVLYALRIKADILKDELNYAH